MMAPKVVRILCAEFHDGLGGVHRAGDIVELPADVALVGLSRKKVELVDPEAIVEHVRQAEEDMRARHLAEQQALAAKRMRLFDNLPPEVRAKVREVGEEAVDEYIASLTPRAEPPKRRRGRPPKQQEASDDEAITGFRSSDGD
jgi:hypothetical protein